MEQKARKHSGSTVKDVASATSCTEDQLEEAIPMVNRLLEKRY